MTEPIQVKVGSMVEVVTFSPNGKYLLSGDLKGVQVWQMEDGKQVATLETTGHVFCLAVSQDGNWIAAGTLWGDIFVWNALYGEVIRHRIDEYGILGVDFSPDSMWIVVSSRNGTATVWDMGTRKRARSLQHDDWVRAAKYSPDGSRIATATRGHVRVWDDNGRLLVDIPVGVTPWYNTGLLWIDNHLLVVSDNRIKELDASTGTAVSEWPVTYSDVDSCIAIPKHGRFIAVATKRTITFWNPLTHSQFFQIRHTHDIWSIAFSPDDKSIAFGGQDETITMRSLSDIFDSIPLPRLHPTFEEPDVQVDKVVLDAWKHGQLGVADASLTATITTSPDHWTLASRALVRARLQQWDAALIDAEKAIGIQPSIIGYIAKSMSHVGNRDRNKAYQACDVAFEHCRSSHITFLLLVKAIIIFMAGDHVDAISRVDDLIATVHHKSALYAVKAYMHLLLGNSCVETSNYEGAIKLFQDALTQMQRYGGEQVITVTLISGWRLDDLYITIRQRLCETLYSVGRGKDAVDSLLELTHLLEKELNVPETVVNWVSDFTKRCLSTPECDANAAFIAKPTPLLIEWAKATVSRRTWEDALVDAVSFSAPKSVVYRALCECLEATGRITDASKCLLDMVSEIRDESDGEQAKWIKSLKYRCCQKLEGLGDDAMCARQHDIAIVQYSVALSLDSADPQGLFAKRSKARANIGLWEDALNDANKVINLDSSSELGYERKHAALCGAGLYGDAKVVLEKMISKMSQSADPETRERSRRYVKPAQIEAAIREVIQDAIRESPLVLINTNSGRLLDKPGQASSFELQPIFHELVSSMTTKIDRIRIEDEVDQYYRYATFSHKWKANEPQFDKVVHIVVYELEESPTHTKLQMFCKIARDAGLHWAWSDTCCINKGDPSVLQETLVSIFQWYQSSTLTVVFLCDAPSKRLVDSVWNSRAWTFQEYHASKVVRFYNNDWTLYRNLDVPNHKESPEIIAEMEEATGVSARALMALRPGLEDIREKLRLASTRQTTRIEDSAYSLLGIFALSLPAVYGEGDKALGRLLAQLLTSSGDTSILAWTGRPGSFNSCLPARTSVFSQLPTTHIPLATTNTILGVILAGSESLNRASISKLYDALHALPVPIFNGKRMKLPSIVFKLGDLTVSHNVSEPVFRAKTDALGIVEIRAEEDLSQFKPLYLAHPWVDFLLDRQPVGSVVEAMCEEPMDERSSLVGEPILFSDRPNAIFPAPKTRTSLASRFGLPFGRRSTATTRSQDIASLRSPSTLAETDRQSNALRVLARLREPFGALLLTPDSGNVAAYKRVASETLITVQVQEITPRILDKLIDSVRVLDVL